MAPKPLPLELSDHERRVLVLRGWLRKQTASQALVLRSRVVLACAEGLPNARVAGDLGTPRPRPAGTTSARPPALPPMISTRNLFQPDGWLEEVHSPPTRALQDEFFCDTRKMRNQSPYSQRSGMSQPLAKGGQLPHLSAITSHPTGWLIRFEPRRSPTPVTWPSHDPLLRPPPRRMARSLFATESDFRTRISFRLPSQEVNPTLISQSSKGE